MLNYSVPSGQHKIHLNSERYLCGQSDHLKLLNAIIQKTETFRQFKQILMISSLQFNGMEDLSGKVTARIKINVAHDVGQLLYGVQTPINDCTETGFWATIQLLLPDRGCLFEF